MTKERIEEKLAILGGEPIRKKEFPRWPILGEDEKKALNEVIDSGALSTFAASKQFFLGGKKIKEFEKIFAEYHGLNHAIAVNSATSGLHCAVAACGIGPGDEVIVPPYTFTATATSILHANAIPIFADIDKRGCISPEEIEKNITKNTKAIIPVHLLGDAANMDAIMNIARGHNLKVIEDCAQSPGTKYHNKLAGTIGDVGVFSFQETKNMATGEGGMIITNDSELAERCRMVRNHGEVVVEKPTRDYLANMLGWNYRMTEMQAAVGIEQFKKMDSWNRKRRELSNYLMEELKNVDGIDFPEPDSRVYHTHHILWFNLNKNKLGISKRQFLDALNAEGIPASGGYPHPLYMNTIFQERIAYGKKGCPFTCNFYKGKANYEKGSCKVAEDLCGSAVWLAAVRPPASLQDMDDIADAIKKVIRYKGDLIKSKIK